MAQRNILVVGASAGGVEALKVLIAGLPASLPLAVFVVLHLSPYDRSQLASILERVAKLPVQCAQDGMPIVPGRVYVAVPDCHLLLEPNQVRITRGPKENRFRPAVDALFRSAAYHFGPRVIGIVLSGSLDDGTAGLWAVKDRGGIALVQSPDDAPFPSMPQNALAQVDVDHILPVSAMPAALVGLAQEPISSGKAHEISGAMEIETRIALGESTPHEESLQLGPLSPLTCPECHGSLVEVREGPLLRYRCHVGHAFSMQSLLAMINEDIDSAFNQALRTLEERTMLLRKVQQQIVGAEIEPSISSHAGLLAESERWEQRVREMIVDHRSFEPDLSTVHLAIGKK